MGNASLRPMLLGAAAIAAAAAVLYVIAKKGVAGAAAGVVTAAGDAAAGAVVGIGQIFGIPATNETECERAKREGRTLDASFACPAGEFIGWAWRDLVGAEGAGGQLTTGDLARSDRLAEQQREQEALQPASGAFGPELSPDPYGTNWGA